MSAATETPTADAGTNTGYLYEGMFLLDSNRFAADSEGVTREVLGILERAGARVVVSRPWQEGKLAYAVEGHRKGLYFLAYFQMPGSGVGEINRLCRISDVVLRQMLIRHPQTLFDAMVEALTSHDGAIHSPEQKPESSGRRRPGEDRDRERREPGEEER